MYRCSAKGGGEEGEASELTEEERERSFANKSVAQRLAIVSAGPLMNLILPFLILPISFMAGVEMPTYLDQPACIGYVVEGSNAAEAGFEADDCVVGVNLEKIESWNSANKAFVGQAGNALIFDVMRDGTKQQLSIPSDNDSLEGMQALGLLPRQEAVIGGLADDMPAAKAGIVAGDKILRIADHEISSWYDLRKVIQIVKDQTVPVLIDRSGDSLTVELTPQQREEGGAYLIGIAPQQESTEVTYGLLESFRQGAKRTWELIELTVIFVQNFYRQCLGQEYRRSDYRCSGCRTGGPDRSSAILSVLAFISIQLGILNLLPIPILDGGHILFYSIELIIRRPLSFRAREISQQIGMAMLLMLMVLAFYNDIIRLWG